MQFPDERNPLSRPDLGVFSDTIHVPGDQPTIQAGIDVASAGDTVLVAPGEYTEGCQYPPDYYGFSTMVVMGNGVHLISEAGSDFTFINPSVGGCEGGVYFYELDQPTTIAGFTVTGASVAGPGGGIYCRNSNVIFNDCQIIGCAAMEGAGLYISNSVSAIHSCRIASNWADVGCGMQISGSDVIISKSEFSYNQGPDDLEDIGVLMAYNSNLTVTESTFADNDPGQFNAAMKCTYGSTTLNNTIIAFGLSGSAVLSESGSAPLISCCDLYGNPGGDWTGEIAGQLGISGNISVDPAFCRDFNPDEPFTLKEHSICSSENNPDCGQIGAYGVGCVSTATGATTWSSIKLAY